MENKKRIFILLAGFLAIIGIMFLVEYLRGKSQTIALEGDLQPGEVAIYWNGKFDLGFSGEDLEGLEEVSFNDIEEQKVQQGWLLKDVLLKFYNTNLFSDDTVIRVSSSSRNLSADVIWFEIVEEKNFILFDLSGRGTLKLVSLMERLDERAEWVQDVDKIEINPQ
jgi:hypothetical protein